MPLTRKKAANHLADDQRQQSTTRKTGITWLARYNQLAAFKKRNGHIQVPARENKELQDWVNTQRSWQRKGILHNDRKQLLDQLGFAWERENIKHVKNYSDLWLDNYKRLAAFKEKHGHCGVPCAHNKTLYNWVHNQRHRKKLLSADQQDLLNEIGIEWIPDERLCVESTVIPFHLLMTSTPPEAVSSPINIGHEIRKKDQKFPVGTRIEKAFDVDGVFQTFGGNVTAFEYFEDVDGTKKRGYLVDYDDGDQEHMLQADVAKHLVDEKNTKRAAKSVAKVTPAKRVKSENAADNDRKSRHLS